MNLQLINSCEGSKPGLPDAGTDPSRCYCLIITSISVMTSIIAKAASHLPSTVVATLDDTARLTSTPVLNTQRIVLL